MWREFFKKLVCEVRLSWPTNLSLGLLISLFSALVDARLTAKDIAFSEILKVEEARVQLDDLGFDPSSIKPRESIDIQKVNEEAMMK